jgi:hypothetical protein
MRVVTISATDVVAPVFSTPEVIALFSTRMTGQTSLRYFLRCFVFERNYLLWVTLFNVRFSRPMTRFTARNHSFPAAYIRKLGMRRMRKGLELIFVTVLAGFASNVISGTVACRFRLRRLGLRRTTGGKPHHSGDQRTANEQGLNNF